MDRWLSGRLHAYRNTKAADHTRHYPIFTNLSNPFFLRQNPQLSTLACCISSIYQKGRPRHPHTNPRPNRATSALPPALVGAQFSPLLLATSGWGALPVPFSGVTTHFAQYWPCLAHNAIQGVVEFLARKPFLVSLSIRDEMPPAVFPTLLGVFAEVGSLEEDLY